MSDKIDFGSSQHVYLTYEEMARIEDGEDPGIVCPHLTPGELILALERAIERPSP